MNRRVDTIKMNDIEIYYKGEPIQYLLLDQQIVRKIHNGKEVWVAGRKSAKVNGQKVPLKVGNRIAQAYAAIQTK